MQSINHFSNLSKRAILFSFIAFLIYGSLVAISPRRLIYDEIYYISIAQDYLREGFTNEFIRNISAPTGILYALVHNFFAPITNFSVPNVRFVSLGLILCSYLLIFSWLNFASKKCIESSLLISAMWLVAPTTGVIGCMALTEIPSICFCLASSLILAFTYNQSKWRKNIFLVVIGLITSGLLLGLSTWGRQNFIVIVLASLPLFFPLTRKSIFFATIYSLSALLIFIYPISIWNGLVPPTVSFVEKGYRISNFILSCSYLGFIGAIVYPKILFLDRKITSAIIAFSVLLVGFYSDLRYLPSRMIVEKLFGSMGVFILSYLIGVFFTSLGLIFIYSLVKESIFKRNDTILIYCAISIVLICLSNIKITHQFSSRYVTLAIPFLLYILSDQKALNKFFSAKFLGSFSLSILFLYM